MFWSRQALVRPRNNDSPLFTCYVNIGEWIIIHSPLFISRTMKIGGEKKKKNEKEKERGKRTCDGLRWCWWRWGGRIAVFCGGDAANSKRNRERKTAFLLSFSVFFACCFSFSLLFLFVFFYFSSLFSFLFLSMFPPVFLFPSLFCSLSCFSPPFLSCPLVFIRGKRGREIYYLCPIMTQG